MAEEPATGRSAAGTWLPGQTGNPRGRTGPSKVTLEVRAAARALVEDPRYRKALAKRLKDGKCAPAVECLLWHYAYGVPKQRLELRGAVNGNGLAQLPPGVAAELFKVYLATPPALSDGNGHEPTDG